MNLIESQCPGRPGHFVYTKILRCFGKDYMKDSALNYYSVIDYAIPKYATLG